MIRKSVWIMGGDGWAYDIGFGGLDHVLASGRDVNILVLDTEVYSNTGGQASKATPRARSPSSPPAARRPARRTSGMIAMAYGNVYVAQIAMGANMNQTVKAFAEAESYDGPSLIIAYSPCIAHGIDMANQMDHQKDAVASGYWPLYRFDPRMAAAEEHPFTLDSRPPTMPFMEFAKTEARFAMLTRTNPERAEQLFAAAQEDINERRRLYEQLAGVERGLPGRGRERMSVDLNTTYLGLELATHWWRRPRRWGGPSRACIGWSRPVRPPSSCPRCSRSRSSTRPTRCTRRSSSAPRPTPSTPTGSSPSTRPTTPGPSATSIWSPRRARS